MLDFNLFSTVPGEDTIAGPIRKRIFFCLVIANVMAVLDSSIINVALPTMQQELHASARGAILIVSGYLIACAISLLPFASLGDKIGHRYIYLLGLGIFTITSVGCAFSPDLFWLVGMRIFQGLGSAALLCASMSLLRTVFPVRVLGSALGINALCVAAGITAGPTIGGFMISFLPWPWLFAVNIPLGLIAFIIAYKHLPVGPSDNKPFDYFGTFLSVASITFLMLSIDGIEDSAHLNSAILKFAASVIFGIGFIHWQKKTPFPLLPLDVFSSRKFSSAAATSVCCFIAQGSAFIALPFLFQHAFGASPVHSALLFTPWPVATAIAAPLSGRLADKLSSGLLSTFGIVIYGAGLFSLAIIDHSPTMLDICWRTALCGLGYGFFQSPNNKEIMSNVPLNRTGIASGILSSARTIGQSLGAGIVGICLALSLHHPGTASLKWENNLSAQYALWGSFAAAVLALIFSISRIKTEK